MMTGLQKQLEFQSTHPHGVRHMRQPAFGPVVMGVAIGLALLLYLTGAL